jgi:hypothetical protein
MAMLLGIPVGSIAVASPGKRSAGEEPFRVCRRIRAKPVVGTATISEAATLGDLLRSHGDERGWGPYRDTLDDAHFETREVTFWMRLVFVLAGALGGSIPEAEGWLRWLDSPSAFLTGLTPFQAVKSDDGFARVLAWISIASCGAEPESEQQSQLLTSFLCSAILLRGRKNSSRRVAAARDLVALIDSRDLAIREIISCRTIPPAHDRTMLHSLVHGSWDDFIKDFESLVSELQKGRGDFAHSSQAKPAGQEKGRARPR